MIQFRFVGFSIIFFLSNFLFAQNEVKIIGNTTNANGKYLYIGYGEPGPKDSVLIQKNKFEYSISIQNPIVFYLCKNKDFLYTETDIKYFYIEPGSIEFHFNYEDLSTIEIKGVKTEDEAVALRKLKIPISTTWKQNSEHLSILYQSLGKENEVAERQKIQTEIDEFEAKDDSLKLELGRVGLEFAKIHPSSFLSPTELHYALTRKGAEIYFDDIKSAFQNFDQTVKTSSQSQKLELSIKNFEKSQVGVLAPDFKMIDWLGKELELNGFRGKYVLLDFWASWCKPCLEDFPHLKTLYSQTNQSDVEEKFFVGAIPVKILIGPDGKILKRWRGGGEPNQHSLTQTLENIFN